jgi:hypothetical protein
LRASISNRGAGENHATEAQAWRASTMSGGFVHIRAIAGTLSGFNRSFAEG